ncbi:MAG: hypothetical protein V7752_17555 [Halopseudomonas sp.]
MDIIELKALIIDYTPWLGFAVVMAILHTLFNRLWCVLNSADIIIPFEEDTYKKELLKEEAESYLIDPSTIEDDIPEEQRYEACRERFLKRRAERLATRYMKQ